MEPWGIVATQENLILALIVVETWCVVYRFETGYGVVLYLLIEVIARFYKVFPARNINFQEVGIVFLRLSLPLIILYGIFIHVEVRTTYGVLA